MGKIADFVKEQFEKYGTGSIELTDACQFLKICYKVRVSEIDGYS